MILILALSGGLVLFGLLSIIMDIFKISSYVGYLHCDSAVKVVFPVVQLIFVIIQVKMLITNKLRNLLKSLSLQNTNNNQLCNHFADIFFVDTRQGLCAAEKEHYTVGDMDFLFLCFFISHSLCERAIPEGIYVIL